MSTFFYVPQYFTTQLSVAGGIDDTQTTGIVLQDISGVDATKPGIIALTWSNPIDTTKIEYIFYTSINDSTNELVGVTRGQEGYSAKSHLNGATVAWPLSKSHINNIPDSTTTFTNKDLTSETNTFANIVYTNSLSRQAIINGNFDVWQRGTTYTPTDSTYIADRWKNLLSSDSGTLPTLTQSRQVLTSGDIYNSFFYIRQAFNGAGSSLGVNSYHRFQQTIENGVRNLCGDGKKITVSFYARSDVAGKKLGLSMYQNYGSGGSPSTSDWIKTQNPITLTSTWTKYTTTFTTVSLSGKTFGTAYDDYIGLNFWYMWGSTKGDAVLYPSVAAETYVGAGYVDIAQVQLCAGDVALPFMPKSYEEELRACQRYYEIFGSGHFGKCGSTSIIFIGGSYKVTKRLAIAPELLSTSPEIVEINVASRTGSTSAITGTDVYTTTGYVSTINGFSSLTNNNMIVGKTDFLYVNAEL